MSAKIVTYLRVSTVRQGRSGLGLEAQRAAVSDYIERAGGDLLSEHVEVESGRCNQRPVLLQAIAQCKREKATLVIAKLDRLARNVAFISALMEAGVEFVAVDAPYATKLMIHILSAFAEHERAEISARTKAALAAAKARGVRLGSHGTVLAEVNRRGAREFAEVLRPKLDQVLQSGPRTLQQISDELNHQGIKSREDGRWNPMSVSRVLTRLNIDRMRHTA